VVTYFEALKSHYAADDHRRNTTSDNEATGTTTAYPSLDAHTFKSMICNRSIQGAYKNITMNHICDRIDIGYAVYDMDPDNGELEVAHESSSIRVDRRRT
jgi:hypothetical protein